MVSFAEQLRILLWKNWTLRRRSIKRLVIEILWPLILFVILWWVRTRGLRYKEKSCHVVEKALPSVGGFEFFQNFLCTLNNTCYDDYVENTHSSRWNDAVIVKFIRQTTPLLTDILSNSESRETVTQIWKDLMDYMKIVSSFQVAENLKNIGSFQLHDLLNSQGLEEFRETVGTYTGLTPEETEDFLNITVHLDKFEQSTLNSVLDDFQNEKCNVNKTYELLSFPNNKSFENLCKLNRAKAFMLLFVYNNYLDRNGFLQKLNAVAKAENQIDEKTAPIKMLQYDWDTVEKLRLLGSKFANLGKILSGFSNLTGAEMASVFIYDGVCGIKQTGNRTLFGVSAGAPNMYDSLRDRLKEWNPEYYYENDPEISAACNTVFQRLESMPISSFMWRQIKPIIRGHIFYAPETEVTRLIMSKVEESFMKLREMELTINTLLELLHRARLWMRENLEDLNNIKGFLGKRANIEYMLKIFQLPSSGEEVDKIYKLSESLDTVNTESALERLDFVSELLSELVGCVRYNKTQGFETEGEAVDAGLKLISSEKLWAVVVFSDTEEENGNSSFPSHIHYKIRMDSDKVDSTRSVRDRLTSKGPRRRPIFDLKYITYGFVYLQEMIERSIVELITGQDLSQEQVYLQQTPYPCYIIDQFIRAISRTFPLFMVLSWVYASAMIIKSIVLEKERRLREVMKIMGVSNAAVWCSWFIESFLIMLVSSSVLTLILKYGKVIEFSDPGLIWLFLVSYTVATICFSFLVSTFFSRANSAAAAGGVIFFISYLPYNMMLIWEERLQWFETLAGCLISNVAFGFGCTYFARFEQDGIGAQWDSLSWKSLPDDDFNLAYCIAMLWFDSALYLVLTWYIEAVFPGEYGVPRRWNFFLKSSYWIPARQYKLTVDEISSDRRLSSAENATSVFLNQNNDDSSSLEADPEGLKVGVKVVNLSKTYSNGKRAVDNLTINFYQDQITSFLGHNGAGKTTTISILTGLFPPTRGTAIINGMDIRKDIDGIRRNLGICPQFNVLFDRLTVYEHLKFYALLKGKKGKEVEREFDELLHDLGIPHKRNCYPSALSGGMKRKLSVAIAFVGGSKTVFLDEPTSGVDPYSRRSIWELLLKYKHGRTVILTTHFMDEADILGDRIAIISQGRLKAHGTSLFLKSHFGQGYTLHLVKNDEIGMEPKDSVLKNDKVQKLSNKRSSLIEEFIQKLVPESIMTENVGSEIAFLLPYANIEEFASLFEKLNENLTNLGILSYGISDTSLEDVFLKITMDDLAPIEGSFYDLSSCCKKNRVKLFDCWKKRLSRKSADVVTIVPPRAESGTTNTTGASVFPISGADGDFITDFDDVDFEEASRKYGNHNPATSNGHGQVFTRKSRDETYANGDSVTSISDTEAAGISLLDGVTLDQSSAPTTVAIRPKLKRVLPYSCLCCIQIYMIIRKRLWNSKRNIKSMFFEIILPAVFIAITLAFTLILPPATNEAPREITPWAYPSPNHIFFADPTRTYRMGTPEEFRTVVNELIGPIGMGTPCLAHQGENICKPNKWNNETVHSFNVSRFKFDGVKFDACSCAVGSMKCPNSVHKADFPKLKTQTGDYILDVTNTNIPEWILKTYERYSASRYGGFEMQLRKESSASLTQYLKLLTNMTSLIPLPELAKLEGHNRNKVTVDDIPAKTSTTKLVYKVWFENKGWLSSVAYLNALHNMWLRGKLPVEYKENKTQFGITLITHPMNLTKSQTKKESLKTAGLGVIHAICIIFALSFIPASFTVYLIEERKCGGKHLHLVSGVRPITYWIGNFIFDMGKYLVPTAICILLFKLFDAQAYIGAPSILSFICLLLLYGWASIPSMYPFSFLFGVPSTAFVVLACSNLFIGVVTTVATFVLEQFGDEELEAVGKVLQKVFLVFPHYCLGRACIELVKLNVENTAFNAFSLHSKDNVNRFEWEHLGEKLFYLGVHGFVYFLFNLMIEYKHVPMMILKILPSKQKVSCEEDIDVVKERERIESNDESDMKLIAKNLTKYYKGKKYPAVNGLTFGIGKAECFGLLGVNGAGKTSTFKMLTGDARISSGSAKICGADVETHLDSARKHFGYCPQEDSIDPLLSGYELLTLYGRLRGLSSKETNIATRRLIKMLGLSQYAYRRSGTYSGGNKRKLSTAIALIGDPDCLFFDEPTSGMDPGARRDLWKVILNLLRDEKTVVLTSHSMEECEVLCTKIAIMVNGQFMCLGSLQHLKNRFGKGYSLTIRCNENLQRKLLKRIEESLAAATLEDKHCSQLKYNIPQEAAQLSGIFSTLNKLKNEKLIEDYSVSQTTLDDIFVKFASQQKDELDR